jgi:hypothetical protein
MFEGGVHEPQHDIEIITERYLKGDNEGHD